MFKNSEFKYLVEEEEMCTAKTEKLSNHLRKYFENKANRKLSSEELMILSHHDFWCQPALKELSEKFEYKNQISEMINAGAEFLEKQMKVNITTNINKN